MGFAKFGATLTKCDHHRGRQKSDSSEQSSKYEQEQQKHAFLQLWPQNRPWLKYLDESFIKIENLIEKECANQMSKSEHLTCKVGLSFKSM